MRRSHGASRARSGNMSTSNDVIDESRLVPIAIVAIVLAVIVDVVVITTINRALIFVLI